MLRRYELAIVMPKISALGPKF